MPLLAILSACTCSPEKITWQKPETEEAGIINMVPFIFHMPEHLWSNEIGTAFKWPWFTSMSNVSTLGCFSQLLTWLNNTYCLITLCSRPSSETQYIVYFEYNFVMDSWAFPFGIIYGFHKNPCLTHIQCRHFNFVLLFLLTLFVLMQSANVPLHQSNIFLSQQRMWFLNWGYLLFP